MYRRNKTHTHRSEMGTMGQSDGRVRENKWANMYLLPLSLRFLLLCVTFFWCGDMAFVKYVRTLKKKKYTRTKSVEKNQQRNVLLLLLLLLSICTVACSGAIVTGTHSCLSFYFSSISYVWILLAFYTGNAFKWSRK